MSKSVLFYLGLLRLGVNGLFLLDFFLLFFFFFKIKVQIFHFKTLDHFGHVAYEEQN